MDFFKSRKKSSISGLKRYWNDFCRRTGYINQENPPTEELYSDYFRKKKEAGETDKGQKISKAIFSCFNSSKKLWKTLSNSALGGLKCVEKISKGTCYFACLGENWPLK